MRQVPSLQNLDQVSQRVIDLGRSWAARRRRLGGLAEGGMRGARRPWTHPVHPAGLDREEASRSSPVDMDRLSACHGLPSG